MNIRPKRQARRKPQRLEEYEILDTRPRCSADYDRDIEIYLGERKNLPSVERQLKKIKEDLSHLNFDEIEATTEKTTIPKVMEYFEELPGGILVCAEHPDIMLRTTNVSAIERFVYCIQRGNILFAFPNDKLLESQSLNLWADAYAYTDCLEKAVFYRIKEYTGKEADDFLEAEEKKIINDLFSRLDKIKKKGRKVKSEYRFWIFHSFAGCAAERILKLREKIAAEVDESIGTNPDEIMLMRELGSLDIRPSGKMSKELKKRGVLDKNGKPYKEDFLEEIKYSDNFYVYRNIGRDLRKVLPNDGEDIGEIDRTTVTPKEPDIKRAMKKLDVRKLGEAQHESLKKLMDDKSVILEAANGGGKRMIAPLYHFSTGKPVVTILPNLASIHTYWRYLSRLVRPGKIAIYSEEFGGEGVGYQALKNFKNGKAKFLLTTSERLLEKKAMAAVKESEDGLLVFSSFQSCLYGGNSRVKERGADGAAEILKSLDDYPCLFHSSHMDAMLRDDISKLGKFEEVFDSPGRSDLKLFSYKTFNMGEKLSASVSLLFELRESGRNKGILCFNDTKNLGRMKRMLQRLAYPFTCYIGGEKEESLWPDPNIKQLKKFNRSSDMALLSYDSFGEGLDLGGVEFVIFVDMPSGLEEFCHLADKVGTSERIAPVFLMLEPGSVRNGRELAKNARGDFQISLKSEYQTLLEFLDEDCGVNMDWNPPDNNDWRRGFHAIDMKKLLENINHHLD